MKKKMLGLYRGIGIIFLIYFPEEIELRSLKVQIRDSGGILKIKLEQRSVMCSHLFLELGRESVQQEKLRLSQSWA